MNVMQGYAAIKPVMPTDGNHVRAEARAGSGSAARPSVASPRRRAAPRRHRASHARAHSRRAPFTPPLLQEACPACAGIPALGADSANNFTQYKARMHAVSLNSNTGNNRYYSFNRGMTHFLVFTAEAYVYSVDKGFLANQVAFAKADLASVDRSVTPWVVALVHKDWSMQPNAFADFSPVLESGGVDVLFCGHVHYYNRRVYVARALCGARVRDPHSSGARRLRASAAAGEHGRGRGRRLAAPPTPPHSPTRAPRAGSTRTTR